MISAPHAVERLRTRYGTMFVPIRDTVIGVALSLYGEWAEHEIAMLSDLVEDGETIIDVGANIGTHTIAFACRRPRSPILAIEPQPFAFSLLCANVIANGHRNVELRNIGCGDILRAIAVHFDDGSVAANVGAFSIERSMAEGGPADPLLLVPVDELPISGRLGLLKIDVEGMEPVVLRGAKRTIQRHRPRIYYEVLDPEIARLSWRLLAGLDYELYWLETWAYNRANFNSYEPNLYTRCELGVLGVPREEGRELPLARVTGDELELPKVLDPRVGYRGEP